MSIEKYKLNENSNVKKVIAILSGKGGVGKSFVTSMIANRLAKKGLKVGILDADIIGPSIPKGYGITEKAYSDGKNINPPLSENGIKIVSVNLILDDPTQPVLWRGPIVNSAIAQFYQNCNWGELDYLLVDMPPGTGDVALTVFQSMPIDGVVIVTSPQNLVSMIVEKAVNMAKLLKIPLLGLVENMSYLQCTNCEEKISIYGPSKAKQESERLGIKTYIQLPLNPKYAETIDNGKAHEIEIEEMNDFVDKSITI